MKKQTVIQIISVVAVILAVVFGVPGFKPYQVANANGQILGYDHLPHRDAAGAPLEPRMEIPASQAALTVSDPAAAFANAFAPMIYTEYKAVASDGAAMDHFGAAVALSGDTALVGAPNADIGANADQGAAYIFTRSGANWSLQQKLSLADGETYDNFGLSVALDGDTALVGVYGANIDGKYDQGAAYVFTRSGATWSLQQKLTAADGAAFDCFGYAVALAGDTALVGAHNDDYDGTTDQGSVYAFTRSGTTWSLQQKLSAPDGASDDWFGFSLALSGDTALVGAFGDDVPWGQQGSAYVITRSGTAWSLQQKLTAADGAEVDWFGYAVALSGDTALVGAHWDDVDGRTDQGSAYVFTRSGTTWSQQQKLTAADGEPYDDFGWSVTVAGDTALVGALNNDVGSTDQGAAYVFTRDGTTWSQQQKLTAADGAEVDTLGFAAALAGDTALVGASGDDVFSNSDQGSAYVFTRSGTTWSQQQKLTAADGAAGDEFGYSVALTGDTALVGAHGDDIGGKTDQGSVYVFIRSGTAWRLQQKLTAADGAAFDFFGWSVALAGDTALVGAYGGDIAGNADQGAAYVFTRSGTTWSQQQKLTAADGAAFDEFGISVALSGDNALVGAYWDDVDGITDQGSAYVFTRSGTAWSQQQKLTAADGAMDDRFGHSVALAGDTALVGANEDDFFKGSAYVFTRGGTSWTQQQRLTAEDGAVYDGFGWSVALAGDTALVGAFGDDIAGRIDQGSAYVFTRSGTTWSLQQKLTAVDGAIGARFGSSTALAGNTALVGAYDDLLGQGSAFIFTRSGTTWTQQAKLTAADGAEDDRLGVSAALSGNTALVGAPYDKIDANFKQGSAYFFEFGFPIYLPVLSKNTP